MISSTYDSVAKNSFYFSSKAHKMYENAERADEDESAASCVGRNIAKELVTRLLNVAQVIKTVVFLALNLIAMIPLTLVALCVEGPEAAWEKVFKRMGCTEWVHYAFLPVAILGIVAPQYSPEVDSV